MQSKMLILMITACKCLVFSVFHPLDFDIPSVNYQKYNDFYNTAIVLLYIILIKKILKKFLNFTNIQKYSCTYPLNVEMVNNGMASLAAHWSPLVLWLSFTDKRC